MSKNKTKATSEHIIAGLEGALDHTLTTRKVHDWIREDLPLVAKMSIEPSHVAKLVDRLCNSHTRTK